MSFLKNPKIIGIIVLLIILIAVPLTAYEVQQQQQITQHAQVSNHGQDTCHLVTVDVSEEPVCRPYDGTPFSASSYTAAFKVDSNDGQVHSVHYKVYANFCLTGVGNSGSNHACVSNSPSLIDKTQSTPFTVSVPQSPQKPYSACGSYQVDFGIVSVDNNAGCVDAQNPSDILNGPGQWAACATGIACVVPSASPTPTTPVTPTNSPTPTTPVTPTDTPTLTPTATPFPTNTPFPSSSPTPTDTPGPSATPTPTTTPGPTDTPVPSSSPTPTSPVVATSTPRPTLPPTGPENNSIVIAGIVGGTIAVVGALLILGL